MTAQDPADRFAMDPSGAVFTQCRYCVHLADGPDWVCKAFPGQIPDEIVANQYDHRTEYPGDDGVTFEARPELKPDQLGAVYRYLDNVGSPPPVTPEPPRTDGEVAGIVFQYLKAKPPGGSE